jgi:chorismate mutase/prephenate dehydratase
MSTDSPHPPHLSQPSQDHQVPLRTRIGFLGPEHSWSHQALLRHVGTDARLIPLEASMLFRELLLGHIDLACIPYYSSLAGWTPYAAEALGNPQFVVQAEFCCDVTHSLLAIKPIDLQAIKVVYGHPVALAEVMPWLGSTLDGTTHICVASGSEAASVVRDGGRADCAAVAPPHAREPYGLVCLVDNIPMQGENVTRFWLIARRNENRIH